MDFSIFDIIIIACGAYMIYLSIDMKKSGIITNSALIGKNIDVKKAKDPQGFIDYIFLKSLILGIIVIISGVVDYCNEVYWKIANLGLIISGVFIVIVIVYCIISMKAQKKYLSPRD